MVRLQQEMFDEWAHKGGKKGSCRVIPNGNSSVINEECMLVHLVKWMHYASI